MKKATMKTPPLMILLAALAVTTSAAGAADSAAELKARFKERYPHLVELKLEPLR